MPAAVAMHVINKRNSSHEINVSVVNLLLATALMPGKGVTEPAPTTTINQFYSCCFSFISQQY